MLHCFQMLEKKIILFFLSVRKCVVSAIEDYAKKTKYYKNNTFPSRNQNYLSSYFLNVHQSVINHSENLFHI